MDDHKHILEQLSHRDGMTAPQGYFAQFAVHMAASLPEIDFEKSASAPAIQAPRSFWQRIRPYAYMAAMFAGVWCMLKLFTLLSSPVHTDLQPSPMLAAALDNEVFVNDYVIDDLNQWDIMDELMEEGFDVQSLMLAPADNESFEYQTL